jgi:hypothetical protein
MEKVQDAANVAKEAQKKLEDSVANTVSTTKNTRITAHIRGAGADLTADGVQNNLDTNKKAMEALDTHNKVHLELQRAKREAGMNLGNANNGGPHAMQMAICQKRIKDGQKKADKFAHIAHDKEAKFRALGNFLKEKLRKAHEAAEAVHKQLDHKMVELKLQISKNATDAAKKAKEEHDKARLAADYAQDKADDASELSKKIADECAGLMSPVEHEYAKKKPDKFAGLKAPEEKDHTERPTPGDRAKSILADAFKKLGKDVESKKDNTKHLGVPEQAKEGETKSDKKEEKEEEKKDDDEKKTEEKEDEKGGKKDKEADKGKKEKAEEEKEAGSEGAKKDPRFRSVKVTVKEGAKAAKDAPDSEEAEEKGADKTEKKSTDGKLENLQKQVDALKKEKAKGVKTPQAPAVPVAPAGDDDAAAAGSESEAEAGSEGSTKEATPEGAKVAAHGGHTVKYKQTITKTTEYHHKVGATPSKKEGKEADKEEKAAEKPEAKEEDKEEKPKMVTVSSDKGKLDNGVASEEEEEKPKKKAAKKATVVVVQKDDTVPCGEMKVVPVGCKTVDAKGNTYQTVTPVIAEPRFKGTWDAIQQKEGETVSVSNAERPSDGEFRKPRIVASLAAQGGVRPIEA